MREERLQIAATVSLILHLALIGFLSGVKGRSPVGPKINYIPVEMIASAPAAAKKAGPPSLHPPVPEPKKPDKKPEAAPVKEEVKMAPVKTTGEIKLAPKTEQVNEPVPQDDKASEPGESSAGAVTNVPVTSAVYQSFHRVSVLPVFRIQIKPVYPLSERAAGKEARVVAEVFLGAAGSVDEIRIIKSGGKLFDQAVIQALKESEFTPGYMDGKPVAVRMQIPFSFKLQ